MDLTSRPYKPNPEKCCEACAFGAKEHAIWCPSSGRIFIKRPQILVHPDDYDVALEISKGQFEIG
jgi:hypothetical protein